jgi:AraC-like DNA-binding protein
MGERTLKRRLAEQETSYTELLDHARHARALELLRGDTSAEEVSSQLGYSDAANFTRAFRRWTGKSPRALRQSAIARRMPRTR